MNSLCADISILEQIDRPHITENRNDKNIRRDRSSASSTRTAFHLVGDRTAEITTYEPSAPGSCSHVRHLRLTHVQANQFCIGPTAEVRSADGESRTPSGEGLEDTPSPAGGGDSRLSHRKMNDILTPVARA